MNRVAIGLRHLAVLCGVIALASCKGSDGSAGPPGANGTSCTSTNNGNGTVTISCQDGTSVTVTDGKDGTNGTNGQNGGNVEVTNFHGEAFLLSTGEFAALVNPKRFVEASITSATADAAGVVQVAFTVTDDVGAPVTGLTSVNALIAKLVPPSGGVKWARWVDYIQRVQTVSGSAAGNWPNPDGTKSRQGTRENNGTLAEVAPGQYTYRFATNLSNVVVDGVAIPYQRSLTHRVQIMMGGHSGATAEATYDFVPDGSAAVTKRDIVPTATCKKCHGFEFSGHGGDRLTMPGCVTCHSSDGSAQDGVDPHGGESIDMTVMIHKIHAGAELPGMAGPDGKIWDDPATTVDERADNGTYAIWGNSNRKVAWGTAEFPAVIANCTVCHDGGAQSANWRNIPSRKACGSCHTNVDFATGAGHGTAGAQTTDDNCTICHPAEGAGLGKSVTVAHDWTKTDIRNIPEFGVSVTFDTPTRGYYVDGETPVITMVLTKNGTPIDHTTVVEDPSGEGCTPKVGFEGTQCNEIADGLFRSANMYVTGPRAKRVPVLHMAARAKVLALNQATFDLSAAGGQSLHVIVESGRFIVGYDPAGEDRLISGDFKVTLPATANLGTLFANPAAATPTEIAAWLMGDTAVFTYNERDFFFRDRATAYVDEATNRLAIRSRPTIANTSLEIPIDASAALNATLFGTSRLVGVTGGASQVRARTNPANTDPKLALTPANIKYTLDPIDAYMKPGTYVVNVEMADMGRGATSDSYRTPSVAIATFQVKQAAVEKPIAAGCTNCHWSEVTGTGYVLDYPRHDKVFDDKVMDQCGGCHDYASAESPLAPTWTTGGSTKPISRRVHSIHNGANLTYPVITVDHEESVPGRNWDIVYPMDVRDCESCHIPGETSDAWKTNPNRIACMGCHDKDEATAHMRAMTYDPTPALQWNGDELETCKACHQAE